MTKALQSKLLKMCTIELCEGYIPFVFNIKLEFKSSAQPNWSQNLKISNKTSVLACILLHYQDAKDQGYGKDWVKLDVNTKRDPPEKYNLHAQTNLKMHVEVFYTL